RLLGVARLAERAAELREAHLDLRVPADAGTPVRAELAAHEIRRAPRDLHQQVLARGAHARDGRLEQVAHAVQLVPALEVRPATRLAGVAEARVEVAVVVLRGGDPLDEPVVPRRERRLVG